MRSPAPPADPGGAGASSRGAGPFLSFLTLAAFLTIASSLFAHGGPPLRIGVTADPALDAIGRLVLVHLRETVGFAVDWRAFPDENALRAAFGGGRIDLAVGLTAPQPVAAVSGDCPPETLASLREGLRQFWGGEAFLLGFPTAPGICRRPGLIVARAVLDDLRFGILGREAARVATLITQEDVAVVRAAAERGGERAASAAARAVLTAKANR